MLRMNFNNISDETPTYNWLTVSMKASYSWWYICSRSKTSIVCPWEGVTLKAITYPFPWSLNYLRPLQQMEVQRLFIQMPKAMCSREEKKQTTTHSSAVMLHCKYNLEWKMELNWIVLHFLEWHQQLGWNWHSIIDSGKWKQEVMLSFLDEENVWTGLRIKYTK